MKVLSVFLVRGASADGTYFDDVLFLPLYYRQHFGGDARNADIFTMKV